mgnify:CR=1 FL=1
MLLYILEKKKGDDNGEKVKRNIKQKRKRKIGMLDLGQNLNTFKQEK